MYFKQTKFAGHAPAAVAAVILAVQFFALHSDSAKAQMSAQSLSAPGLNAQGPATQTSAVAGSNAKPVVGSAPATCTAPTDLARFERPLIHTMRRLANGQPLTIVAIGSSSTAGAGASSPDTTYPSRLAVELRTRFPGREITVLNRGVNGEETDNMMARFAGDVLAAHPQLVLWQIGTNSVLRDHPLNPHAVQLHDGIEQLKGAGADVVLIDPQFAPAVLAKSETSGMVEQIALAAKQEDVDLFRRFAVMRDWHDVQHLSFGTFVSPDQLHMNDWSYACLAKLLGGAIAEAATRPIAAASVRPATISARPDVH
ncbi:MAG TPA: SGNH/GDSL hydrolase family protein [Xanthobacteraceae bacterium]|jgi:acyl-CoA thioesterase-1|nr:SGNH/GDSL hydrolase family protein [Xanthobacteraceae bacterium]